MPFVAQHIREARNHLRRCDPVMREIVQHVGPFTAKTRRDRFGSLAGAIVAQQISGKAARSIWDRLVASLEPDKLTAESIDQRSLEQLRDVGVSRQKGTYLKDLSVRVLAGEVQLNTLGRKNDDEVIAELTQIKGIGRWTAQMFLIFTLGRLDVLPVDDLGVRTAIHKAYNLRKLPDAGRIEKIAQPWRPYASVASWYLWRSLEN
ncbi:MAG: DNA-3-methyladenine glycosylase family protein [Pirellulaceae bacterium]